jgi:hypothetical protein
MLGLTQALPACLRTLRRSELDRPARLLALAIRALPAERREWGLAMGSELDRIHGALSRWRFSLGCAWAAAVIRIWSREPGGERLRVVVLAGIATELGLVAYGLVRYPGLRSGARFWVSVTGFVILLALYAATALLLSRGIGQRAKLARHYGLIGAVAIGVGWIGALSPTPALKSFVLVPLLVVLLAPVLVGALASRAAADRGTGTLAALWTANVGGLLVFAIWVVATYVDDGRPYDPGLVRDFHRSGAPDLATFAVSDNLGSALMLLLLVPTVALALGSLGGRIGVRHR